MSLEEKYSKKGQTKAYYDALMKKCDLHLEQMEQELPPSVEKLEDTLRWKGVKRRDFLKWCSVMTTALMLPPIFNGKVARAAEIVSRIPVVWLNFAECTGCTEAVLRSSYPDFDTIILETLSLEYHETLLAASGYQAEECLEDRPDGRCACESIERHRY